jgi:hypothetical protein
MLEHYNTIRTIHVFDLNNFMPVTPADLPTCASGNAAHFIDGDQGGIIVQAQNERILLVFDMGAQDALLVLECIFKLFQTIILVVDQSRDQQRNFKFERFFFQMVSTMQYVVYTTQEKVLDVLVIKRIKDLSALFEGTD